MAGGEEGREGGADFRSEIAKFPTLRLMVGSGVSPCFKYFKAKED